MWRWVGIACLIYGLAVLWLLLGPRPAPPGPGAPRDMDRPGIAGGRGEPGRQPQPPAMPGEPFDALGQSGAPSAITFDGPTPPPFTLPKSETHIIDLPDGGRALEWRLPPQGPRLRTLALPIRPPADAANLLLTAGADRGCELRIGLRENDGSLYVAPRALTEGLDELALPLADLQLSEAMEDENTTLDLDQVSAVVLVRVAAENRDQDQGGLVITLDNISFS